MITALWVVAAAAAAVVMMAASRFALRHAVAIAETLDVPAFLVGVTLVAIGTDTPEILNSLISSYLGHGDINVGDSIGSAFTQATLVLGLFPFIAGAVVRVERREILLVAGLTLAALGVGAWTIRSDGYLSRTDAALLVLMWGAATGVAWRYRVVTPPATAVTPSSHGVLFHVGFALVGFAAVGAAAAVLVEAVVSLSTALGVPEYILAFFGASVGTSLPELAVEFTALRKGQRQIALGDVLGSCLVDASLSIGVGPLIFPTVVSVDLAMRGAMMASAAMLVVAVLLGIRGVHNRVTGALLLLVYGGGYGYVLASG